MNQVLGLINLSLVPLRAKAADASEMTSQLLFGDCFEILERTDKWVYIRTSFDHYEGWIDQKQFIEIDADTFTKFNHSNSILGCSIPHSIMNLSTNEILHLVAGSSIPDTTNGQFQLNTVHYQVQGQIVKPDPQKFASEVIATAKFYLNTPYLWGGRSPFGIDCSGFTQLVFKQFNFHLKRDAYFQAKQGVLVNFLGEANAGDLAFFDNEQGKITHVGIMINNTQIIHASGKVRIDLIDNQGIFNEELKRHTHKLRIIKRMLGN
jgi:hypothetical protein